MKKQKTFLTAVFLVFTAATFLFLIPNVRALTPTLSLTGTGDGDSIKVEVSGDPNKSVLLSYTKANLGIQLVCIGTTNSDGKLSTNISTANYAITPNSAVHIIINKQQSQDVAWPYLATGSMLSLDKTSLVLPIGQSATITASNNGTNFLYLSMNSNPPVANVSISGNKITVTAINYGATTVTVCSQTSVSTCASAYVNVQNTGAHSLAFSQNSVSVAKNLGAKLSVYGGTGAYIILNNSNPGAINAVLDGNNLTLTGYANEGSSSITVCSSDISACGIINASIGGVCSSGITLNQTTPNLKIGETLTIPISGGTDGSYSVFLNTDANIVRADVTGNSLVLYGLSGGSATVIVCSANGRCAGTSATVAKNVSGDSGPLTLSQNNSWLLVGQSFGVKVSGGTTPYSVLKNSDNILASSLADNILTITGVNPGSTNVNVCSAEGGCVALAVLVNGTTYNTSISLSKNNVSLVAGQSSDSAITGNGGYYVANNTNQNVAEVSVNGNTAIVSAVKSGNAEVSICQNGGQCAIISITVLSASIPVKTEPAPASSPEKTTVLTVVVENEKVAGAVAFADNTLVRAGNGKIYVIINNKKKHIKTLAELRNYAGKAVLNASVADLNTLPDYNASVPSGKYKFKNTLSYGVTSAEVKELQKCLTAEGFYRGAISGRYLISTVAAVKQFQKKNGIKQTGNVGPQTMSALNRQL